MSNTLRRFEILLPQQYNDGRDIPRKLLGFALKEVIDKFDAASFEPMSIEGHWRYEGIQYTDSLSKIVVDVPDIDENRQWMRNFKTHWKAKLGQIDLWLVSYEIDIE